MKISDLFFVSLFALASCSPKEQYTINGTIADTTQTTIYLQQRVEGKWVNVDSAALTNGKFKFTGKVNTSEEYYLSKGDRDKLLFFLENAPITVTADSTLLGKANVSGGPIQDLYNTYKAESLRQNDALYAIEDQWQKEQDPQAKALFESKLDSIDKAFAGYREKFIEENPSSPVSSFLVTQMQYGMGAEELNLLVAKLDTSLNNTVSYKAMVERVKALQRIAVGKTAPDFTMNDTDGNPVAFSSVYSQNQYTLVDFWASWCGPCRAENPNVVSAFKKYGSKGFGVFGVSLDNDKERWQKAIADDQLTWVHVSDLKGWSNEAAATYCVNSIPSNFLVDQNGTIIGSNLRGEDLMKKLEELLK